MSQERERLTASAAFLNHMIIPGFEYPITKMKTKINDFMNIYPPSVATHALLPHQVFKFQFIALLDDAPKGPLA